MVDAKDTLLCNIYGFEFGPVGNKEDTFLHQSKFSLFSLAFALNRGLISGVKWSNSFDYWTIRQHETVLDLITSTITTDIKPKRETIREVTHLLGRVLLNSRFTIWYNNSFDMQSFHASVAIPVSFLSDL